MVAKKARHLVVDSTGLKVYEGAKASSATWNWQTLDLGASSILRWTRRQNNCRWQDFPRVVIYATKPAVSVFFDNSAVRN